MWLFKDSVLFIYYHQYISRCPPLQICDREECIVCIWRYGIWLCGGHYISGDGCHVSSHVNNLSRSC